MTREEAVKMAKADLKCAERDTSGQDEMCNSHKCDECILNYERGNIGEQKEWLRLAIKALEQEPCEDTVSRKAVHDMLENLPVTAKDKWFNWLQKACMRLAELPPATPQEPRKGHWIEKWDSDHLVILAYECSECGMMMNVNTSHFCPNCGADIRR